MSIAPRKIRQSRSLEPCNLQLESALTYLQVGPYRVSLVVPVPVQGANRVELFQVTLPYLIIMPHVGSLVCSYNSSIATASWGRGGGVSL